MLSKQTFIHLVNFFSFLQILFSICFLGVTIVEIVANSERLVKSSKNIEPLQNHPVYNLVKSCCATNPLERPDEQEILREIENLKPPTEQTMNKSTNIQTPETKKE